MPMIVACIPAFEEERAIGRVVLLAEEHADKVLVCDDGSKDMTEKIAERLGAKVLRHEKNIGYGASIASLLTRALEIGADVIVTLDGDGQHDPHDIPRLIEPIIKGDADIVIGSRFEGKGPNMPGYRAAGVRVITSVSKSVANYDIKDAQSGFRAYSRAAAGAVIPSDMGMGASTEILAKASRAGLRVVEVGITVSYFRGSSTHNPLPHGVSVLFAMARHASIKHPLLIYGLPGLGFLLFGALIGYKALEVYAAKRIVNVNTTLIGASFVMIGLILLAVAVILWVMIALMRDPEYRGLARMFTGSSSGAFSWLKAGKKRAPVTPIRSTT